MPRTSSALLLMSLLWCAVPARAYPPNFQDAPYLGGLTEPVALAWAADGRLFIAERTGRVKIWDGTTLHTALTLAVQNFEEQGLLGLALHPGFPGQPYVYLLYTPGTNPQTFSFQRLSRFTVTGNTLGGEQVLHSTLPTGYGYHVAGCVRTTAAGHLYVTDGENGHGTSFNYAQDLTRLEGKMIRLNLDGTIPSTNPFVGTPGARTEIYHRGLRNPFRFALQPSTDRPFICDVGAFAWEEIDTGPPGSNFGWSTYEGMVTPQPAGITNPLYAYSTSGNASIVGCAFYTGGQFPNAYIGNFFFLDHSRGQLGQMVLDGSNNVVSVNRSWGLTATSGWGAGPVDLAQGPDGALYYTTYSPGAVRRVAYTGPVAVPAPPLAPGLALAAAPNPFTTTTRFHLSVREAGPARLILYDLGGRRVRVLIDGPLSSGEHGVDWDGRDAGGRALPAGLYVARLESANEVIVGRIALTR
jgi:glucose/arabinose dehydrogenase